MAITLLFVLQLYVTFITDTCDWGYYYKVFILNIIEA